MPDDISDKPFLERQKDKHLFAYEEFLELIRYWKDSGCSFHSCSALGAHPVPRGIALRFDIHERDIYAAYAFLAAALEFQIPATFYLMWDYAQHEHRYFDEFHKLFECIQPPVEIGLHDSPVDAYLLTARFNGERAPYEAWLKAEALDWVKALVASPEAADRFHEEVMVSFAARAEATKRHFGPITTAASHGGELSRALRPLIPTAKAQVFQFINGLFPENWMTGERLARAGLIADVEQYKRTAPKWVQVTDNGGKIQTMMTLMERKLGENCAVQMLIHPNTWDKAKRDTEISTYLRERREKQNADANVPVQAAKQPLPPVTDKSSVVEQLPEASASLYLHIHSPDENCGPRCAWLVDKWREWFKTPFKSTDKSSVAELLPYRGDVPEGAEILISVNAAEATKDVQSLETNNHRYVSLLVADGKEHSLLEFIASGAPCTAAVSIGKSMERYGTLVAKAMESLPVGGADPLLEWLRYQLQERVLERGESQYFMFSSFRRAVILREIVAHFKPAKGVIVDHGASLGIMPLTLMVEMQGEFTGAHCSEIKQQFITAGTDLWQRIGMGAQIHYQNCRAEQFLYPDNVSLILIAQTLYTMAPDERAAVIEKAINALAAGGMLVINEMVDTTNDSGDRRLKLDELPKYFPLEQMMVYEPGLGFGTWEELHRQLHWSSETFLILRKELQETHSVSSHEPTLPAQPVSSPVTQPAAHACEVCEKPLLDIHDRGICPHCNSRPRVRTIPHLLEELTPQIENIAQALPLLAFSATVQERQFLDKTFRSVKAVSLFGKYGGETGVDARDLSRYPDASFCGIYSCQLFDYFPEHEQALKEAWRVMVPGGVFMTHIATPSPDSEPPKVHSTIVPRAGYYEYIPEGESMQSVRVGRDWFLAAMRATGFEASHRIIKDRASGIATDWFVGIKPKQATPATLTDYKAPTVSKTYHIPLPPVFPVANVDIRLSLPLDTGTRETAHFSCHNGNTVIAGTQGGYYRSEDNGASWVRIKLPGDQSLYFQHAQLLSNGDLLLQSRSIRTANKPAETDGTLVLHNASSTIHIGPQSGNGEWHGTSSIDEKDGVLMYADYQPNGTGLPPRDSRVLRSRDGGRSWETVFMRSAEEIRHFHLLRADPVMPRTWWLSSGDLPEQSRVWVSRDDGDHWHDMTANFVPAGKEPHRSRSIFRLTDLAFTDTGLIWGTDDTLGNRASIMDPMLAPERRAGSRLFYAERSGDALIPQEIGYCGQAVRSIVDCGPAWIVLTQGQVFSHTTRPQVFLLGKSAPYPLLHLFDVDNYANGTTGFTYSCASRDAANGVFFSIRGKTDVFNEGNHLLRWEVSFS